MTQIKSENAKEYIAGLAPEIHGESSIEIIIAKTAIRLAETEAEERHAKELQELKDKAIETFAAVCKSNLGNDCERCAHGVGGDCCRVLELFTQKLNQQ